MAMARWSWLDLRATDLASSAKGTLHFDWKKGAIASGAIKRCRSIALDAIRSLDRRCSDRRWWRDVEGKPCAARGAQGISERSDHVWRSAKGRLCAAKAAGALKKVSRLSSLQSKHGKQCRLFPCRDSLQGRAVRHGRHSDLFDRLRGAELDEVGRDCAASIPNMHARWRMDGVRSRLRRCCGPTSTAKWSCA